MSSRTKSVLLLGAILSIVAATSWCSRRNAPREYSRLEGVIFGTFYHITYNDRADWHDSVTVLLAEVDNSLSMFNKHSIISRFNRNDSSCVADSHFRHVFETGQHVSQATGGAFDMTVAPIVNLWGFGFTYNPTVTPQAIDSAMQFIGWQNVSLDSAGHLRKLHPETILDASSIAKGYAVDVIADFFNRHDIRDYMVEIGGEVVVRGLNPKGENWAVGISKPQEQASHSSELQAIVHLTSGGIATSGNYRNFYYKDGKRYSHTVNPHTGYPVQQDILSATVLATDCMTADAYATAFMVLGSTEALNVLQADSTLKAFFILAGEGDGFQTLSYPDDWVK